MKILGMAAVVLWLAVPAYFAVMVTATKRADRRAETIQRQELDRQAAKLEHPTHNEGGDVA